MHISVAFVNIISPTAAHATPTCIKTTARCIDLKTVSGAGIEIAVPVVHVGPVVQAGVRAVLGRVAGIVVGLAGTGDDTKKGKFASEAMANMFDKFGLSVDSSTIDLDNAAAVMLTAELPPFARNGSRIDVLVSSIGDAASLQGGTLMLTPLRGPDGRVYAMAQGPLSVGGFSLGGGGGKQAKNHPTVGRIANGGVVEREPPSTMFIDGKVILALETKSIKTVHQGAGVINEQAYGLAEGIITVKGGTKIF